MLSVSGKSFDVPTVSWEPKPLVASDLTEVKAQRIVLRTLAGF